MHRISLVHWDGRYQLLSESIQTRHTIHHLRHACHLVVGYRVLSGPRCLQPPFSRITLSLWSITVKNTDWSTGPLARPFARGTVNDWMAILSVFFSIFDHSAFTFDIDTSSSRIHLHHTCWSSFYLSLFFLSQVLFWYHLISDIRMAPSIKHSQPGVLLLKNSSFHRR